MIKTILSSHWSERKPFVRLITFITSFEGAFITYWRAHGQEIEQTQSFTRPIINHGYHTKLHHRQTLRATEQISADPFVFLRALCQESLPSNYLSCPHPCAKVSFARVRFPSFGAKWRHLPFSNTSYLNCSWSIASVNSQDLRRYLVLRIQILL